MTNENNLESAEQENLFSENEEDVYVVEIICNNCKRPKTFVIEKGIEVTDFLDNVKCEFCNCKILKDKKGFY